MAGGWVWLDMAVIKPCGHTQRIFCGVRKNHIDDKRMFSPKSLLLHGATVTFPHSFADWQDAKL
jgi:hypothetical protein